MLRFLCESKNKMLNRISFNGNWKGNWRFELEEVGWMLGSVAASAKLSFKYLISSEPWNSSQNNFGEKFYSKGQ